MLINTSHPTSSIPILKTCAKLGKRDFHPPHLQNTGKSSQNGLSVENKAIEPIVIKTADPTNLILVK